MEREDIPIEADIAVYYLQENLNLTDFRKEMKNKLPFIKRKTSKSAHTRIHDSTSRWGQYMFLLPENR